MADPLMAMNANGLHGGVLTHDRQASALWEKLRAFSFDDGGGPNTFARRLAREQGWSADFAGRAIEEYRRFLLLFVLEQRREVARPPASVGAPPVRIVPSAVVDKVWHLHLLYTQSYWETLCRDILGQPLHHQPANGAGGESALLDEVYRANMEAYRTTFGELAPADIWPAAKRTPPPGMPLAEILAGLDTLPGSSKRALSFLVSAALVLLAVFALYSGMGTTNSLDWPGVMAAFIGVLIAAVACTGLFVALMRRSERPRLRRTKDAGGSEYFFCGGAGDAGSSSVDAGHSHGSHDSGHADSGGGHSCGGHSCGGHGCGGH